MTKHIISALVMALCTGVSFAQIPQDSITLCPRNLDQIVVTGTRTPRRLGDSPVLTTVIGERDMRGAASVSALESLQDNIPGLVVSPNAMGNNLRIKGLSSLYVLMLVDGERLVSEGAGGNINLDQIDVNTIKRIEVVDGAASALYGSNAVGAVINIITKEPFHNVEAGVGQSWESPGTLRSNLNVASSLKKFSLRAGGFRNSSEGFGGEGDGPYAARYEDWGANLKAGFKPSDHSDVSLTGRWFRHETFNPQGTMNVAHPLTHNMTLGANGGLATLGGRNRLRVSVNFDRFFDYDVLERKNGEHKRNNTATLVSSRAVNTFAPGAKWELVGGMEHNHEENFSAKILGEVPTTKSVDDVNVFAQAGWKPLAAFDIAAGARYTCNSAFGSAFSPKLSVMYSVAGFKFRGGVGTAFRAPSIKELYYDFDHQGMFWVYGNPDLRPEKGLYASLSAEYTRGSFNASLAGYHNRISGKITQYDVINTAGRNEKYYKNVSRATLRGFDLNATCTLSRQLALRGSYSFCDAIDHSTVRQLESNVRHSATMSATWNGRIRRSPFSLQLAGRVHSPVIYYQGDEAVRSRTRSVWKVVVVKPFTIAGSQEVEITFKVDNLFNHRETSFIDSGRRFLIGVKYNFKYHKRLF